MQPRGHRGTRQRVRHQVRHSAGGRRKGECLGSPGGAPAQGEEGWEVGTGQEQEQVQEQELTTGGWGLCFFWYLLVLRMRLPKRPRALRRL